MAKENFILFKFTGEPGEVMTDMDYALLDKYFPQAIKRLRELAQKLEDAVVSVEMKKL